MNTKTDFFKFSAPVFDGLETTNTFYHLHTVKAFGSIIIKSLGLNYNINADFGTPMIEFIPIWLILLGGVCSIALSMLITSLAINNTILAREKSFINPALVITNSLTSYGLIKLLFDGGWWNFKALGLMTALYFISYQIIKPKTYSLYFTKLFKDKYFLLGFFLCVLVTSLRNYIPNPYFSMVSVSEYLLPIIMNGLILSIFVFKNNITRIPIFLIFLIGYGLGLSIYNPLEFNFLKENISNAQYVNVIEPKTINLVFPKVIKIPLFTKSDFSLQLANLRINPSFKGWNYYDYNCHKKPYLNWVIDLNLFTKESKNNLELGEYIKKLEIKEFSDTGNLPSQYRVYLLTSRCLPYEIGQPTYIYRVLAYNGFRKFVVKDIWKW